MGRGKALAAEGFSLTGAVGGPTLPAHTGPEFNLSPFSN